MPDRTDAERTAELERQVRELNDALALAHPTLPGGYRSAFPAKPTVVEDRGPCATCKLKLALGTNPICNCVVFGPKVTCAVVA